MSRPALPDPFNQLLSARTLDADPASVCVIDPWGRILFVNRAWDEFARANGGSAGVLSDGVVGTLWLDAIRGENIRRRFKRLFDQAVGGSGARPQRVTFAGECNSASTARRLSSTLAPVSSGTDGAALGVLAISVVVQERPLSEAYQLEPPDERRYRDAAGFMKQCCSCRRVRVQGHDEPSELVSSSFRWEMVPHYIAVAHALVSHGFCPACLEAYYGPT